MINLIILMMLTLMISLILLILNLIFHKQSMKMREKLSPFECGFDPLSMNRIPFSIHFFMISLIFLIFDIEITLLIPLIYMLFKINKILIITSLIFLFILIYGLYIEYLEMSIDWIT